MSHLLRPRHDGKAMYFPCIDDYFTEYNKERCKELGQPFGPSLAGGGLAFLLDGTQTAACMQVAAGCVISGTTDFYIVSHMDCGAYRYFAGVDWKKYDNETQVASLWRDLRSAEAVARDFLSHFSHPFDSSWEVPEVTFHPQVIDLEEKQVGEPDSLEKALPYEDYRGIRVPKPSHFAT